MNTFKTVTTHFVMRSMEISLKSNMWLFKILFGWSAHLQRYVCWKPRLNWTSGSKVMSSWRIPIGNKRNSFLFLALSHNQCSRLLTDSAKSQHMNTCCLFWYCFFFHIYFIFYVLSVPQIRQLDGWYYIKCILLFLMILLPINTKESKI